MDTKAHNHGYIILWCAAILALMPVCGPAAIKNMKEVDLEALTYETQKSTRRPDELTLVWWIPQEFWSASMAQDPTVISVLEEQEFLRVVRPYTMVIVVDGIIGPFGAVTYPSEREIRATTRIVDAQGNSYAPLTEAEMDSDVRSLIRFVRPYFVNIYGTLGQNVHILLFPGRTTGGAPLADATNKGRLKITLGDRQFQWQLPLDSLLLGKVCNGCMAECKGSWSFCPWCGRELTEP